MSAFDGFEYTSRLETVAPGCHAWILHDGSWGWSNSGLVVGDGASLLIDTLFDHDLTQEMLSGTAHLRKNAPLVAAFNTHGDGDHFWGNHLLPDDLEIIATELAAEEMDDTVLNIVKKRRSLDDEIGDFTRANFRGFNFDGVVIRAANSTFTGDKTLDIGGREVILRQIGPAHTPGDAIAFVPDARVVYTGDLLFIGGTPIVWAGPIERWVAGLDIILSLDADVFVPGHGPVTDRAGVQAVRDYLVYVKTEATDRFNRGMDVVEAVRDIDLSRFAALNAPERIAQNVMNVYATLDPASIDGVSPIHLIADLGGFRKTAEIGVAR